MVNELTDLPKSGGGGRLAPGAAAAVLAGYICISFSLSLSLFLSLFLSLYIYIYIHTSLSLCIYIYIYKVICMYI